jgi:quinolinate synthase
VDTAAAKPGPQHVPVVLGTEAGMITSIVTKVQSALRAKARPDVDVEIVFPVATEAVAAAPDSPLQLVPGVAGGEGCSTAGGCATCPFMKMNSLDALQDVLEAIGTPREARLAAFRPKVYAEKIGGRTVAEVGGEPILHMRAFQQTGRLPDALVQDVLSRGTS